MLGLIDFGVETHLCTIWPGFEVTIDPDVGLHILKRFNEDYKDQTSTQYEHARHIKAFVKEELRSNTVSWPTVHSLNPEEKGIAFSVKQDQFIASTYDLEPSSKAKEL